jgi:hypothetical protein
MRAIIAVAVLLPLVLAIHKVDLHPKEYNEAEQYARVKFLRNSKLVKTIMSKFLPKT